MAFFTAYTPPGDGASDPLARAIVIKDGFSWPAFVFTGFWLLSKRLWLAFLGFALAWGLLMLAQAKLGLSPAVLAAAQLTLGVFLGLEAPAFWGRKLLAKGWQLADVVEGVNHDQAERRFFERALAAEGAPAVTPPAPSAAPPAASRPLASLSQGVIGMFPEAQGR